ncbi:polyphenol oxidase [Morganella morganii]|uniref:purine nucleoside phosphorylase YfiH n=1 Tax=Morganella morganii TaxID=582 RepID=UPI00164504AE|nr:purine nucleoside phosphorylase YfiH [Morganella morganii]MBC3979947.1 polyphenol oxidase [Morganella morganii]
MTALITPQWPLPTGVRACSSLRTGGVSQPPFDSLNLGLHTGDSPEDVARNRAILAEAAGFPDTPLWLNQVHGTDVAILDDNTPRGPQADAVYTRTPGKVCAIMTADCLPVLFCSRDGREVAGAHAGWRSLCGGVLENTVSCFTAAPSDIIAWLGPAIGPQKFEVGAEVREAFMAHAAEAASAFIPHGDKYLADIYQLARQRLAAAGVTAVSGGTECTVTDSARFFSYRRDARTGRMASFIWITPPQKS